MIHKPRQSTSRAGRVLVGLALVCLVGQRCATAQAMWFLQEFPSANQTISKFLDQLPRMSNSAPSVVVTESVKPAQVPQAQQELQQEAKQLPQRQREEDVVLQESMSPFSIAGIRPASIASLLNTVSDTGFSYFNVHDQCRSRTACDVGFMLYKKLNFIHNWIIRTSVRTLVDVSNVYSVAWNNGMLGKNCTLVYPSCSQSPLESLMSFAMLAS